MIKAMVAGALGLWVVGCKPDKGDVGTKVPTTTSTTVDTTEVTDTTVPDDKGPIDDSPLFDADHVVEVTVALDAQDWADLRGQTRNFIETLGFDCLADPFVSPFTEFVAEVTVDGEVLAEVGIRKKGFLGSLSVDKPGLKIDTDTFVEGQAFDNGTERITLNNAVQDPSFINQCLGYGLFLAAGLPAPRCNFATVTVNDEALGVYAHIEAIKKDFLRRHFTSPDGDLYEGTLSDFVVGWDGTFAAKTDETDAAMGPIRDVMAALDVPDAQLLDALSAVLDLPQFYRFWAMETLVGHGDGYASNSNNFYLYKDPGTGLLAFIPWGTDSLFGYHDTGAVYLSSWLPQRLFEVPEARAAYVAAMTDLLATVWDEAALLAEIDRMAGLLDVHLAPTPERTAYLDNARSYVENRRAAVERDLPLLVDWQLDATVRAPFCLEDLGPVTASFATAWDTLADDVFRYAAELDSPAVPQGLLIGSAAGPDGYGATVVTVLGVTTDWRDLYQLAVFIEGAAEPGTYSLDSGNNVGWLFKRDLTNPYDEGTLVGLIAGDVTFTALGTTPDAPVEGTLQGTLLGGLF